MVLVLSLAPGIAAAGPPSAELPPINIADGISAEFALTDSAPVSAEFELSESRVIALAVLCAPAEAEWLLRDAAGTVAARSPDPLAPLPAGRYTLHISLPAGAKPSLATIAAAGIAAPCATPVEKLRDYIVGTRDAGTAAPQPEQRRPAANWPVWMRILFPSF